jgi:hypothetical protein
MYMFMYACIDVSGQPVDQWFMLQVCVCLCQY